MVPGDCTISIPPSAPPPSLPINFDQRTIPFMLSKILLHYKNGTMPHSASDDIESLIYVLVWMCVLYASPGTLRKDRHITQTVLKPWVTVSTVTDVVSLGVHKARLKIHPRTVVKHLQSPPCFWVLLQRKGGQVQWEEVQLRKEGMQVQRRGGQVLQRRSSAPEEEEGRCRCRG